MKLIVKIIFLSFCVCNAHAERVFLFQSANDVDQVYQELEDKTQSSSDWSINGYFKTAFSYFLQDDYAKFGESIEELKYLAGTRGYTDLSDYSMELLRNAAVQKDAYKTRFLVDKAVYLSPADSRVAFVAASFYRIIGTGKALKLFFGGLYKVKSQPILLVTLILNLVVVALIAATVAVFFVYFVQMLRNSNRFREALIPYMPWKYRGVFSIAVLLLVSVLPFFSGILIVLLTWGICLSYTVSKRYLLAVGILCLAWGYLLPKISTVAYNLNDPSSKVFEDLNLSRYSPKSEQFLKDRLNEMPNDGSALFFLAQTFRLKGFQDSASQFFTKIDGLTNIDNGIRKVARANLGVVAFDSGNYAEALELLKQAEMSGVKGFEIYYNLAIANLLLLDMTEYNRYYSMARKINPNRISDIVAEKYLSPKAILIPVSSSVMINPLFKKITSSDKDEIINVQSKYNNVMSILLGRFKSEFLMVVGVISILYCYGSRNKKMHVENVSPVWVFFPFGRYIGMNRIGIAILGLTLIFMLVLLSPSGALTLYGSFKGFESFYNQFLYTFLLLLILLQILNYQLVKDEVRAR